ncbi:helix-turn-helix transcriptional regulator [Kosakonia sacchari]|uniref:helix-turn-helix transcriptional regulator n=1 Tax=Kosakonia sacchari TaxID=1158459 RepID=UPI000BE4BEB7|nr:LuxR C-terminal-related transcriptional regulator [Kosakonia sacchari]PDO83557.1 LuxR family transcriptional regulator [Kosakonia sacchari]
MYIISQDSYFVMGMDKLLKAINPHATHTLVAFDRGDGKILFFSMNSLLYILGDEQGFNSFICTRFIAIDKNSSVSLLRHEIRKILNFLKGHEDIYSFREIHISATEYRIMVRFLNYQSSDTIAKALGLDKKIVSNYKNAILRKLGLNSMADLIHIYNNWNDCFCCMDGKIMPDATFLPRMDTNELKMIRRGNKPTPDPVTLHLCADNSWRMPAMRTDMCPLLINEQ